MQDYEIIGLYFSRDETAISETDKKYGHYCRCIAFNILRCDEDSEECTNDTYLRAWLCIPPQRPERLKSFLGKITRNLALGRYEKGHAAKRGGGEIPILLDELEECIGNGGDTADEAMLSSTINKFLSMLDAKSRRIFVRRYWYMSPISEIANENSMTVNHVTVLLHRLRAKLKKQLESEGITV